VLPSVFKSRRGQAQSQAAALRVTRAAAGQGPGPYGADRGRRVTVAPNNTTGVIIVFRRSRTDTSVVDYIFILKIMNLAMIGGCEGMRVGK
jgi:hypothetical protein